MVKDGIKQEDKATDDILNDLRASLDLPATESKEAEPKEVAEKGAIESKIIPSESQIKLEEKDLKLTFEVLSEFLASRNPKWRMSEAEINNFTLLTCKLGEKYSAYYLQYSLEATACVAVLTFILKRVEIKRPIKEPIIP